MKLFVPNPATGASINVVFIILFDLVYKRLAEWLTQKELHRYKLYQKI